MSEESSKTADNKRCIDQRRIDMREIRLAYCKVDIAIQQLGKLLRTTEAGRYMWSARHKTAISGIRAALEIMRNDMPPYDERD